MRAIHDDAAVRAAIVTGAASGIGLSIARRLHADGWSVVAVDRDADGLRWVDAVEPDRERIVACAADVTTEIGNAAMVNTAVERFGSLHGVALNAGVGSGGTIEGQSIEEFDRVLAVNLRGVMLGIRAVVPPLRAAGGAIAVTASISGMFGDPGMSAYNASKGGVLNLARSAALEFGPDGVRVNAVCPGPIGGTGMTLPLEERAPELYEEMRSHVALGRFGRPDEVAAAIAWLLSDDASYITGIALPVDGGLTASTGMTRPGFRDH